MMDIRTAAGPRWRRIVYLSAALVGVAAGVAIGLAFSPVRGPAARPVTVPIALPVPVPAVRPGPVQIPADARVVTVTPLLPFTASTSGERPGPAFTITDPVKVARIAAVVNALPQLPPGVYDCPAEPGSPPMQVISMQLTFTTSPRGPMVASVDAVYVKCQTVSITVGSQVLWLGDYTISGQQLQQQVLAIAGVPWPSPRS